MAPSEHDSSSSSASEDEDRETSPSTSGKGTETPDQRSKRIAAREKTKAEQKAKKGIGLGVVEPGSYADLLVINGNPLEKLEILRDRDNLRLIMQDGKIWKNTLVPAAHPQFTPVEGSYSPTPSL